MPFFSIVIPTYNSINHFHRCIDSLNIQEFKDYEVLISDGGSSDGTEKLINSESILNLTWSKSEFDNGIYDALNYAFSNVKGDWIIVLGSDDYLYNSKSLFILYSEMINFIQDYNIFYSDIFIRRNNKIIKKKYPDFNNFFKNYSGGPLLHHQSLIVNKSFNYVKFDLKYKIHSDYNFICSILEYNIAKKINCASIVFSDDGMSSNLSNLYLSICEIYSIRKSFNLKALPFRIVKTYIGVILHKLGIWI